VGGEVVTSADGVSGGLRGFDLHRAHVDVDAVVRTS
jgi:hypothetical protein